MCEQAADVVILLLYELLLKFRSKKERGWWQNMKRKEKVLKGIHYIFTILVNELRSYRVLILNALNIKTNIVTGLVHAVYVLILGFLKCGASQ